MLYSYGSSLTASCSFTVRVPQELLAQHASLVVFMVDASGNQCIGKCQLDSSSMYHKISQEALTLTTWQEADCFDTVVDLMTSQATDNNVAILHFEFDSAVRILRLLVVKDSLLEENPFDVLTLPINQENFEALHHEFNEFEQDTAEFDELSALVSNVDSAVMDKSIRKQQRKTSLFEQYMLYAEIYMLMQYGKMKRAMSGVGSWFSQSE